MLKHGKHNCSREQARLLLEELRASYQMLSPQERGQVRETLARLSNDQAGEPARAEGGGHAHSTDAGRVDRYQSVSG